MNLDSHQSRLTRRMKEPYSQEEIENESLPDVLEQIWRWFTIKDESLGMNG